jgi:hypothetical protein
MPDAQGKLYLSDFVADLKARGFDALSPDDLQAIVNRAYFAVARKSRWQWERATIELTLNQGEYAFSVGDASTDLPNFRSLERIYMTTAGVERKLIVMKEDEFFTNYLNLDLTKSDYRNEPSSYFVYDNKLYILSPPVTSRDFVAYYFRRPTWLHDDLDPLVTPIHLDEAIVDASRIRAHTRVNEPSLAAAARQDLEEQFDDMRDDEEEDMHEYQERVSPDNTWL